MNASVGRALLLGAVVAMAAYCATHLRVVSDVSSFMPTGGSSELAALSRALTRSEITRSMVLTIGGPRPELALDAARRLGEALRDHPEVAWLRTGIEAEQLEDLFELYFPRRYYFLSDAPASELPGRFDDGALREQALRLRAELRRPSAPIVSKIAAEDPLLVFPEILERVMAGDRELDLRDGQFVSRDGRHAVVLLGSVASPFDSAHQRPLLDAIDASFARIRDELDAPLVLESAGVNRFAVDIERSILGEIPFLFIAATVGVALIFLAFFRSLRALCVAMIPHACGVLTAATVGLAVFGQLNGLAIAFGVSLIGVSIDYSVHLLNHHALSPRGEAPARTAQRLRPSLLLGGATTLASLIGLAFADFPGFYQMGVLASIGVSTALAISLLLLPGFMQSRPAPAISHRTAAALGASVRRLARHRGALLAIPIVSALLAVWGYGRIDWLDDLSRLTRVSPEVEAENERVRKRVTQADASRFLIATGENIDDALAQNDQVFTRLPALVQARALTGFRSLHSFVWSEELQRANRTALLADPSLGQRLDRAYAEAGFQPGAFAGFERSVEDAPPPLRPADLSASALGDVVGSMILDLGERTAVITYLEGVRDVEAVAAAVSDLPGVRLFDQKRFFQEVYAAYRERIIAVVISGCLAVFALLLLRYRSLRPALAAALPSLLVAGLLAALAAATRTETHILHGVGLVLVMGMGVDYGIFMVDSAGEDETLGATMLSLLLSCLTTILIFGVMGLSAHPVLNAIGRTAGVGIALAFLLAPVSLILVAPRLSAPSHIGGRPLSPS